jgi:hypothetical protein
MQGTEWVRLLPACEPGHDGYAAELKERERMVLEVARTEHAQFNWCSVGIEDGGHTVELLVLGDAMRVGDAQDQVRPSCTQPTLQRIADYLGALLPTEKIADIAWRQAALQLVPHTMTPDSRMASTARMLEHSRAVSRQIVGAGFLEGGALFGAPCKLWCISNRLKGHIGFSCNFGWHVSPTRADMPKSKFRSTGGLSVLQPLATAHKAFDAHGNEVEANHNDYSQGAAYLVSRTCTVDGVNWDLADLYRHPTLSKLVSYEGPLELVRHPAVELSGADPYPDDIGRGSRGELVATWQRWLRENGFPTLSADGDFGPRTEAATMNAQARANLPPTGKLDIATQALMGKRAPELHAPSGGGPFADDVEQYPNVTNCVSSRRLAKFYLPVRATRRRIRGACIHTAESLEAATGAEAVAAFFADPKKPLDPKAKPIVWVPSKVSGHFTVDNNSTVQCVPVRDVAYCAPGINNDFVHVELSGYARQSVEDWDDEYSRAELAQAARLFAALVADCAFPAQFIDAAGLKQDHSGITTHAEATKAYHESDHTDPGPNFPMERFIALVQKELEGLG